MELPTLELCCFGPPTARLGGCDPPPDVVWRKHLALLIYLALSADRTRSREHLLGLLWPEKPDAQARHSLNEALRRLRASLGADRLVSHGEAITLTGDGLAVDAVRFEALAATRSSEAAALVRGDFLEGFALDDAPAFEEWAGVERSRYRSRSAAALVALGEDALARSRISDAESAARRALALQPYAEPAARLLMRAAALAGDAAGALAAFHAFSARLAADLGEHAGRELVALGERIRAGRWRAAGTAGTGADEDPPLVGREATHARAFQLIAEGIAAGPRTLLIAGEPGSGKSRLLAECLRRVALEGAVVATARPLESDLDVPWSALRSVVHEHLLDAPGSAGADPAALSGLGAVPPEWDHARVADALAELLRTVAEEQPIALAVDDAHFADESSLAVLGAALQRLATAPVLLLLTAPDSTEGQPRELLRLRGNVGRTLPGALVRLEALAETDLGSLVAALAPWCDDAAQRDRLTRRLAFETGGNPFLAVSLLRALQGASEFRKDVLAWPRRHATIETPLPITVPDLARMAILVRVADLDGPSLQLLRAASIGGSALDLDLIATISGLTREDIETRLSGLEARRLVAFDGARYVFAAPLIAKVVRGELLPPGERRRLRHRAIAALAARTDFESLVLRAELQAKVAPGRETFEEALRVAQAALAQGTVRAARRALLAAERCLTEGEMESEHRELEQLRARLES